MSEVTVIDVFSFSSCWQLYYTHTHTFLHFCQTSSWYFEALSGYFQQILSNGEWTHGLVCKRVWSLCYCGTGQTIVKQTEDGDNKSETFVFNIRYKTTVRHFNTKRIKSFIPFLLMFLLLSLLVLEIQWIRSGYLLDNHLQSLTAPRTRPRLELLFPRTSQCEIRAESELRCWITAARGRGCPLTFWIKMSSLRLLSYETLCVTFDHHYLMNSVDSAPTTLTFNSKSNRMSWRCSSCWGKGPPGSLLSAAPSEIWGRSGLTALASVEECLWSALTVFWWKVTQWFKQKLSCTLRRFS